MFGVKPMPATSFNEHVLKAEVFPSCALLVEQIAKRLDIDVSHCRDAFDAVALQSRVLNKHWGARAFVLAALVACLYVWKHRTSKEIAPDVKRDIWDMTNRTFIQVYQDVHGNKPCAPLDAGQVGPLEWHIISEYELPLPGAKQ